MTLAPCGPSRSCLTISTWSPPKRNTPRKDLRQLRLLLNKSDIPRRHGQRLRSLTRAPVGCSWGITAVLWPIITSSKSKEVMKNLAPACDWRKGCCKRPKTIRKRRKRYRNLFAIFLEIRVSRKLGLAWPSWHFIPLRPELLKRKKILPVQLIPIQL